MRSSVLQRLLEIRQRTTASGHKVQWDEPGESDTAEIRRHNTFLNQKHRQKQDAKQRLKTKGIVPTKNGKPIFEQNLEITEDLQQVLMVFRRLYQSNRPMRFREWIKTVAELLDAI